MNFQIASTHPVGPVQWLNSWTLPFEVLTTSTGVLNAIAKGEWAGMVRQLLKKHQSQ
jgi:hypothetical protein